MPRFLIEIRHSDEYEGCVKALDAIVNFGSHLVTNAEFGCEDGEHAGWVIVEVDTRAEVLQMVPPKMRDGARIVQLRQWTRAEIEAMMKELEA
jgi:hypothetical protein